jgi:hypothetical protein
VLATSLLYACAAFVLVFALLMNSLPPTAKSLIHTKEGQAFIAASWKERSLIHDLLHLPREETELVKLLIKMLDEFQTGAGQEFATASLDLAQRLELESELARVGGELKQAIHAWLRSDGRARAAAAEFQTYGRSLESIIDAYIDNAIHDLKSASDAYPSLFASSAGAQQEKPLERIGNILDRFFERYPLPDLSFVKNPPEGASEAALALLNDKGISKEITALNFKNTVAPPGGLAVTLRGQNIRGTVAVGGFEFLRELETGERCFVNRYRRANGYPVVFSYEKEDSLVAVPACLSTDLVGGTIAGPLIFHRVTTFNVPLLGQLRPNVADKQTHKTVIASSAKKIGGLIWLLPPPQTGRDFVRMLERVFPTAMQEIAPQLPGADDTVWTSTRDYLIHANKG